MQISVFGHETILTDETKKYANEKLKKLIKYQKDIIGMEVTLEENHHQKNKEFAFVAKALVKIPGYDIKAQAEGKTLFAAVDELEKKLGSQLRKNKDRKVDSSRGKNFLKKLFRR
jgi:putative sigma-54 modulation protein